MLDEAKHSNPFFSKVEKCHLAPSVTNGTIGELIVYEGIRRPSIRPSVVRPSVNIFKRHLL